MGERLCLLRSREASCFKIQPAGRRNAPVVLNDFEVSLIGDQFLADWTAEDLARHPAVSRALCGGGAGVALASRQDGVKVEVEDVSVHEVTVDDVVHVTIQVLGEHVNVQVCGQPVLPGLEAGWSSKLTQLTQLSHPQQAGARVGRPGVRAPRWQGCVLGFEGGEL